MQLDYRYFLPYLLSLLLANTSLLATAPDNKLNSVHEPDPVVLGQFKQVALQLQKLAQVANKQKEDDTLAKIADPQKQLAEADKQYRYTSPGMLILGPLGAAGIVLKQKKLEKIVREIAIAAHGIGEQLCGVYLRRPSSYLNDYLLEECIDANERLLKRCV